MEREGRGRKILGFIVGLLILMAFLLGAIYFVRQQMKPANTPSPEPARQEQQPAPQAPKEEEAAPGEQPASEPPAQSNSSISVQVPTASVLPETGSADVLPMALVAAIISGVVVAFIRSRQPRLTL